MRAAVVGAFSSSFSLRIVLDWEASVLLVGYSSSLVRFVLCSTAPRAREESCCAWALSCFASFATSWQYSSLSRHAMQKHGSKQVLNCMERRSPSDCLSIITNSFYQLAPLQPILTSVTVGRLLRSRRRRCICLLATIPRLDGTVQNVRLYSFLLRPSFTYVFPLLSTTSFAASPRSPPFLCSKASI